MRSLLAILLVSLVIGGLVVTRTINVDRNSPAGPRPAPPIHTVKQLLIPGPVPFQTLFWNEFGHSSAGVTAISDSKIWSAFWHNQTQCDISNTCPNLPKIDFDSRTVLIVAAGLQGDPGYHINVTSVVATHDGVLVDATLTTPGLYCVWAAVVTFPTQVIEIPQTNLPMTFNMTEQQGPACPY